MALKNRSGSSAISNEEMKRKLEAATGSHADPIVADTDSVSAAKPKPVTKKTGNAGRKKSDDVKNVAFAAYFSEKEANAIKTFCEYEGRSTSSWIRTVVLRALRDNGNTDI